LALRPLEIQTASTFTNEEHFQPLNNASNPFTSAPARCIGGKEATCLIPRNGLVRLDESPLFSLEENL
jgi:hypothetical protein